MMWMDVAFRFWKDSSKFLLISCPKGVRILFTSSFFKIQNLLKKLIIYVLAVLDLHCSLGFALVAAGGATLQLQYSGFSLQWLLLWQNTGPQVLGRQQLWLLGSGAQAQWLWCTGLAAARHAGSSWTRDRVSCFGRLLLYH